MAASPAQRPPQSWMRTQSAPVNPRPIGGFVRAMVVARAGAKTPGPRLCPFRPWCPTTLMTGNGSTPFVIALWNAAFSFSEIELRAAQRRSPSALFPAGPYLIPLVPRAGAIGPGGIMYADSLWRPWGCAARDTRRHPLVVRDAPGHNAVRAATLIARPFPLIAVGCTLFFTPSHTAPVIPASFPVTTQRPSRYFRQPGTIRTIFPGSDQRPSDSRFLPEPWRWSFGPERFESYADHPLVFGAQAARAADSYDLQAPPLAH